MTLRKKTPTGDGNSNAGVACSAARPGRRQLKFSFLVGGHPPPGFHLTILLLHGLQKPLSFLPHKSLLSSSLSPIQEIRGGRQKCLNCGPSYNAKYTYVQTATFLRMATTRWREFLPWLGLLSVSSPLPSRVCGHFRVYFHQLVLWRRYVHPAFYLSSEVVKKGRKRDV